MTETPTHRERPPKADPAPVLYTSPEPGRVLGPVTVTTTGSALLGPRDAARRALVQDHVPARLLAKDHTLWGPDAEAEAAIRLGWVDLPRTSRELLPRLAALREELAAAGLDRVVLCGMGGSSLAPEVICATYGAPLVTLDTTDPGQVRAALTDLDRTVFVVSSKSGSTVETDSHLRLAVQATGWDRVVVVTDPGSALAEAAEANGARAVFLADRNVGGRYSALSAFGLVPSALAGVDVAALLDDAEAALADLAREDANPGLDLGAALGGCGAAGRDKVVIVDAGSGLAGFGDWAEQLIAESTGKLGRGLLPVVVEAAGAAGTKFTATGDVHVVRLGTPAANATAVEGPLGAQFLVWEYATAVAGRTLRIDPFDQPDVESAKASTRELLSGSGSLDAGTPAFVEGPVEVHGETFGATDLAGVVRGLLAAVPPTGYVAVHAYLDRFADADAAALRPALAALTGRPVTFGWGPRFLHSTGQYHKGGPASGVFLQLTGAVAEDVDVPGRDFTLGRLQLAQALGDGRVLAGKGRPVTRLHLTERAAGLAALRAAVPEPPA
ncbi:MAG TPA: glucose-6-phosphate isomerase [Mycobacteriales bacterium]|jgi:glucose-6-phosphate isomerase|nr:glucose-6-phosphate isomerase [Mycobacteriales bacterium]